MWLWMAAAMAAPPVLVEVGTTVPTDVGVGARVEWPGRVRTGLRLGVLPGPYVDAINGVAMAFDAYGEPTADVIRSSLQRSLVASLDVGWRFTDREGWRRLSLQATYRLATLGGSATGQELLVAASGIEAPRPDGPTSGLDYDLGTTVHLLGPELLWEPPLTGGLRLAVGLGAAFTVGARTRVDPTFTPRSPAIQDAFTEGAEAWLDQTLRRYVHTPTFRIGLAYAFGG